MKVCSVCKESKSLDNFYNMKASKDKLYPRCKDCDYKAHVKYKERDPIRFKEKNNWRRIKHLYGITKEEYLHLAKEQNDVCKICKEPNDHGWMLAVDHCHDTGRVRGLLCNTCNRALGFFDHDPERILRAKAYIEHYSN